jgi:hypothetical protein
VRKESAFFAESVNPEITQELSRNCEVELIDTYSGLAVHSLSLFVQGQRNQIWFQKDVRGQTCQLSHPSQLTWDGS